MVLCSICTLKEAVYTCPICSTKTCSVSCVKRHKLLDCSGCRRPYLPKSSLNETEILADAAFLDSHPIPSSRDVQAPSRSSAPDALKVACAGRNTTLERLPAQFQKHMQNQSRVDPAGNIRWTVSLAGALHDIGEHQSVVDRFPAESGAGRKLQLKLERPVRWVEVRAGDCLSTLLRGTTVIEFPELRMIVY